MKFADIRNLPVQYSAPWRLVLQVETLRIDCIELAGEIVNAERHQEEALAVSGQVSAGNGICFVGTNEHEPGIAHPSPRDVRAPWRMIDETERLYIEDPLKTLHGLIEITDDNIKVMDAVGRH